MLKDPICHTGKREALKEDCPCPPQGSKEQTFATEKHRFEATGALNIIADARCECRDTTCVNTNEFIVQIFLNDSASHMNECHSIALQTLKNEPFTTEKTCSQALSKGNINLGSKCGTEEGIFLTIEFSPVLGLLRETGKPMERRWSSSAPATVGLTDWG